MIICFKKAKIDNATFAFLIYKDMLIDNFA